MSPNYGRAWGDCRPTARAGTGRPIVVRLAAAFALCLLALAPFGPIRAESGPALPAFAEVQAGWQASELRVLDRQGRLLSEIRVDPKIRRTDWTPLAEVSPALIAALLGAEDRRFFEHAGVDWLAAGKAALSNWLSDRPRGASTLTMQLVGLLEPAHRARAGRRNVSEKWDQMQAARALERHWSKAQILEAYLNLVPFRGEFAGIDAAARGLFDRRPAGLGAAEALILAALIRAPNARPGEVARRACALAEPLPGSPGCAELKRLTLNTLTGRYAIVPAADWAPHLARRLVQPLTSVPFEKGERLNTTLTTTLDAELQRFALTTLKEQLARLGPRNVQDAALLVADNASGEVLAYVSLSGPGSESPHTDGVAAPRQAGSTLKPFLYGLALERRLLTAASALEDAPLAIATAGGEYAPRNYDQAHRGLVSLRTALASSLNIPAVRVLTLTGLEPFAARLGQFGFRGLTEAADFYGYALALGSLDVSLEELVNAYRTLANGGLHSPLRFVPGRAQPAGQRVQRLESVFLIADILSDRQARAATFGLENPLATRFWSAVKTGTSKDMRDNWCVGFSSRYTVGVWVGNFDGSAMHDVSGISGAAPAWAAVMARLHEQLPSHAPKPPAGLVRKTVRPFGEIARPEWFLPGTEPRGDTWAAAAPPAEIVRPGRGAILALDPDLPPERQRLSFLAHHAPEGAIWELDARRQDSPDWALSRGRHQLILKNREGMVLDQVDFEVR